MKSKLNLTKTSLWKLAIVPVIALVIFGFSPDEGENSNLPDSDTLWVDLITPDMEGSKKFYGKIMGWQFKDNDHDGLKNCLISINDKYIGSIYEVKGAKSSVWVPAVTLTNAQLSEKSTSLVKKGAKVALGKMNMPGIGSQVVFEGAQGEEFSLIEGKDGSQPNKILPPKTASTWLGVELWADKPEKAINFYKYAFDVTVSKQDYNMKPYWYFQHEGKRIAGMVNNPINNQSSQWVPYVYVSDAGNLAKSAEALGAYIVASPTPQIRHSNVAIIQDPHGAIICLHTNK